MSEFIKISEDHPVRSQVKTQRLNSSNYVQATSSLTERNQVSLLVVDDSDRFHFNKSEGQLFAQGAIGYSSVSREGSSLSVPSSYVSPEI